MCKYDVEPQRFEMVLFSMITGVFNGGGLDLCSLLLTQTVSVKDQRF